MSALARIHIAKKQLGLDDDTYRDVLERVTNKRSSKGMSYSQHMAVIDEFKRLGWNSDNRPKSKPALTGPYAKKLQALWIAGWNLGLVKNRNDKALIAFVKRQTGIQSLSWLRDPKDADKAVEALKKWLERSGVDWSVNKYAPPHYSEPGFKITKAQCQILNNGCQHPFYEENVPKIIPGKPDSKFTSSDWITIMNALGVQVRVQRKVQG